MAYEFKLPDIGEGMAEGEIVRWLVKEGDTLAQDQPMVEVMTDKATVEIATPHAGHVLERRFKEGERCPVGSVLIVIEVIADADKTPTASMAKTPGPTTEGPSGGILATPATRRCPLLAGSSPHRIRKVVVFPAPFGPRRPNTSPRSTEKEVWFTAVKAPKVRTRSLTSMTVSGGSECFGKNGMVMGPGAELAGWMARSALS